MLVGFPGPFPRAVTGELNKETSARSCRKLRLGQYRAFFFKKNRRAERVARELTGFMSEVDVCVRQVTCLKDMENTSNVFAIVRYIGLLLGEGKSLGAANKMRELYKLYTIYSQW